MRPLYPERMPLVDMSHIKIIVHRHYSVTTLLLGRFNLQSEHSSLRSIRPELRGFCVTGIRKYFDKEGHCLKSVVSFFCQLVQSIPS